MALQVDKVTYNLYYLRCLAFAATEHIFRIKKNKFGEKLKLEVRRCLVGQPFIICLPFFLLDCFFWAICISSFFFFIRCLLTSGHFHAPLCLRFGVPLATNQRPIGAGLQR